MTIATAAEMEALGRQLWGEPNQRLSKRDEIRFGANGSKSLDLKKLTFFDHESGEGGGYVELRKMANGGRHPETNGAAQPHRKIVATYPYHDQSGALLFEVVRFAPKDFRQRRPDGNGGHIWNLDGVEKVLFRLPEVVGAVEDGRTVYVTEGEKAALALASSGLDATCSPGGANKWRAEYGASLAGADVVILPDNDAPGEAHALDVARKLTGIARSIRILRLPGLPDKGDVWDWIYDGGAAEQLEQLARDSPEENKGPFDDPSLGDAEAQPAPPEDDALTISRLASLPAFEYDRIRRTEAARLGVRPETLDRQVHAARSRGAPHADPDGARPPAFTDEALALRFTERHADRLRYVATWGRWLIREPAVWRFDETLEAFSFARAVCREAAAECNDGRVAPGIASAKTVAAVERLAKADRRHAATVDQWDADPWLLNTPAGVVELRTGRMRAHRPGDHMTKCTAVAPAGECPLWHAFLDRITGGDGELKAFLQRVAGYGLTGSTREHALFFGYGTGGNGKGVFLNTLTGILGGYASVASMETFTASHNDRHPTDLAMLRGARLVTAQETEEGRRWAEARIKALTGGDPVTARFMRQDFFTFIPTFKLFIAGNHKPGLRNVDEAIRRRFHLIPFEVKIPAAERDEQLPEKLRAEWPGILKWAIGGCLAWQERGIALPIAVQTATDAYLEAEDAMALWQAECCTASGFGVASSSELFASWRKWAEAAGEQAGSQKTFSGALEARGFTKTRQHGGTVAFKGIYLRAERPHSEPASDRW